MNLHFIKYSVFSLFFLAMTLSCAHRGYRMIEADIISSGTIYDRDIGEASGIAASHIHEDLVWVINDSGNSASIYALNPKGKVLGTLNMEGISNNDWEDLASFKYEGKPYILIADIGDNAARRKACFLHFLEEPDIEKTPDRFSLSVKPSWSMTYTYEDGPRDCESVAVDILNEKIFLLSKRDNPPILYELPLTKQENAVARRCGEIKPLPRRTQEKTEFSKYSNQPTAMDISSDGLSVDTSTTANPEDMYLEIDKDAIKKIINQEINILSAATLMLSGKIKIRNIGAKELDLVRGFFGS